MTNQELVLDYIKKNAGLTRSQIGEAMGLPVQQVKAAIYKLRLKAKIWPETDDGRTFRWHAGSGGRSAYIPKQPDSKPVDPASVAMPPRYNCMKAPAYSCPELRSVPFRPGAMDAYLIASGGTV